MAWCGASRKARQCRASSGGGAARWSVSTSTPYIPWQRRSSKALRPFFGGMYGWVFCAKSWQLEQLLVGLALQQVQRTHLAAIKAGAEAHQQLPQYPPQPLVGLAIHLDPPAIGQGQGLILLQGDLVERAHPASRDGRQE